MRRLNWHLLAHAGRIIKSKPIAFLLFAAFVALAMGLFILPFSGARASPLTQVATPPPPALPSATVKIWNAQPELGNDPDESVADPTGLTVHVATAAAPLTIVTVYENTGCPGGPCGITYWNPVTNVFKCFGVTSGFQAAVDINRSAPVKTSTSPSAATFQPGDAWASGPTSIPIYVNFKGTGNFRGYPVGSPWGIEVDQATGNILFAGFGDGTINRLDPATNTRTAWSVGGTPRYLVRDSAGRIYATVGALNQIIRVDPINDEVRRWAHGSTHASGSVFATPDGITIDGDGNVWAVATPSNEVLRLNPTTNVVTKFTKPGLSNPQLVETSGSGGSLQVFVTEGSGNAVTVITPTTGGTSTTVTPTVDTPTVAPSTSTVAASDFTRPFKQVTITPTTHTIPGVNGALLSGKTTAAGEPIPVLLRFPFGTATPPTGTSNLSGMTHVYAPNTLAGSDLGSDKLWELKSGAIIAPAAPAPGAPPAVELGPIEAKLDKLETKVDRLEAKADRPHPPFPPEVIGGITKLESKADRLESKADRIEAKADRLEGKADAIAGAIAKLEGKADRLESKADRIEAKADRLEVKADEIESKLDRLETQIAVDEQSLRTPGGNFAFYVHTTFKGLRINANVVMVCVGGTCAAPAAGSVTPVTTGVNRVTLAKTAVPPGGSVTLVADVVGAAATACAGCPGSDIDMIARGNP